MAVDVAQWIAAAHALGQQLLEQTGQAPAKLVSFTPIEVAAYVQRHKRVKEIPEGVSAKSFRDAAAAGLIAWVVPEGEKVTRSRTAEGERRQVTWGLNHKGAWELTAAGKAKLMEGAA